MNLGRIVGTVVCTRKDNALLGHRLLVVEPLNKREKTFIALDAVDSGAGETVIYIRGKEASYAFLPDNVPCDGAIIAIVDDYPLRGT